MKETEPQKKNGDKAGLALGSGAARGWAHIGVIRALNEAKISIHCVAGASIGALVGAVMAAGRTALLEQAILRLELKHILAFIDPVFPKSGLIDGRRIADLLRQYIPAKNIEELPVPFRAVAADLQTGCEVVLQDGDVIEAVRASISLPGIFTPVKKNRSFLIDGGLVNPVPVSTARSMGADFVIAVDLNSELLPLRPPGAAGIRRALRRSAAHPLAVALQEKIGLLDLKALKQIKKWMAKDPAPSIFEVLLASIRIMQTQITKARLQAEPPDLLIQPRLGHIKPVDFHRAAEAVAEGYRAAKEALASGGPPRK